MRFSRDRTRCSTPCCSGSNSSILPRCPALSPVSQRRDLVTGNVFFGHNSLTVHFGLADAELIDSLVIRWPSGLTDIFTSVAVNTYYEAEEGGSLGTLTSVVDDPGGATAPDGFGLIGNFPNPFNPSTTIRFRLDRPGRAGLKVFDLLGREVAALFEGEADAGIHEVTWNAAGTASGLYYYRLIAGSRVDTRTMILMR